MSDNKVKIKIIILESIRVFAYMSCVAYVGSVNASDNNSRAYLDCSQWVDIWKI